jgi:hypothetical protein
MVDRETMLRGLSMISMEAMLTKRESEFLYDFAASFQEPIKWVELGVWCGRGMFAAGCGLPRGSCLSGYDTFTGELPVKEGSKQIIRYAHPEMVYRMAQAAVYSLNPLRGPNDLLEETSVTPSVSWAAAQYALPTDVLIVDAAHDYESVCMDLDAWLPKMKPGSTIIGHDYTDHYPGVKKAFDERFGKVVASGGGTRFCWVKV